MDPSRRMCGGRMAQIGRGVLRNWISSGEKSDTLNVKYSSHSESSHIPQSSGARASARENRPEWVQRTIVMPHACITRRPSKHTTTDIFNTLRTACFPYKKYAKNGVAQRFTWYLSVCFRNLFPMSQVRVLSPD